MAKLNTIPPDLDQKLTEIRSWLFYGDLETVRKNSGKSYEYCCRVLNGKGFNMNVIECAIEVMNKNKMRLEITPKMKIAS